MLRVGSASAQLDAASTIQRIYAFHGGECAASYRRRLAFKKSKLARSHKMASPQAEMR